MRALLDGKWVLCYNKNNLPRLRAHFRKGRTMNRSAESSYTEGPLLKKLILFTIPLMLSGILQLLFNAADLVVVGRYAADHTALAAVGATGALINLITNLFIGLSVGCSVSVAQYFGAKEDRDVSEVVHTSIVTSIIGGVIVMAIGLLGSRTFLGWMDTPADVIDQATLYMTIYFVGMPAVMLYNFGAAILRSIGDTRNPLIYLSIAGVLNVFLNLYFVIALHMGVAGVALATILSQTLSAALIVIHLFRSRECYRLELKKLRIYPNKLVKILRIGIPAGLQGTVFSISNVVIQSSVNSFGSLFMSGSTAASNIEGFIYIAMNAFHHTALTFVGQNMGAKKYHRVTRIFLLCLLMVTVLGLVLGMSAYLAGPALLSIYCPGDAVAISYGMERMAVIATTYFLCGMMDVMTGTLRGMGYSVVPMIITVVGVCGIRILWIYTVFAAVHTPFMLFISYTISWIISFAAQGIFFLCMRRKMLRS